MTLFANTPEIDSEVKLLPFAMGIAKDIFPGWLVKESTNTRYIIATSMDGSVIRRSEIELIQNIGGKSIKASWTVFSFKGFPQDEPVVLLTDLLDNETDIIGWMSQVKAGQYTAAIGRLVGLFQGRDLFPQGDKQAVLALNESVRVANEYLISANQAMDEVYRRVWPVYKKLWQVQKLPDRTNYALEVDGIGLGKMVGRYNPVRQTLENVEWRIAIPIRFERINNTASQIMLDHRGSFRIIAGADNVPRLLTDTFVDCTIRTYLANHPNAFGMSMDWKR